ncbi:MAG: lipase [Acidobacteria bacterium]|nr:lipase [Acidobacteriota bacterium]
MRWQPTSGCEERGGNQWRREAHCRRRREAAGVAVDYVNYDGVTRDFFGMGAVVDKAKQAEQRVADGLKDAFAK